MAIRSTSSSTPWLVNRLRTFGTDAQNIELEAYAEELEAEAFSSASGIAPIPGFADLLEAATIMVEICELMLRNKLLTDARGEFLTTLEKQMEDVCSQIELQMNPLQNQKTGKTKT
jgi:hypothetical protein